MKRKRITGIIHRNLGRGEKLGYPTANIHVAEDEIEEGIHVGHARIEGGKPLPSLVFIGAAETFNEFEKKIEVHILDFSENIYDKEMSVELIEKIRDNQKFASEQELIVQMKADEKVAREFFNSQDPSDGPRRK